MSLVGTRPPTVDEWEKYELHHRARLAAKPGLKVIIPILFMCVCGAIKGSLLIQILCSIVVLYDLGDTIT